MNSSRCHQNGTCTNNDGSYSCNCDEGFSGNGQYCININECETGMHDCHDKATCIDTAGSFMCQCESGYSKNDNDCVDVDECILLPHDCHANASCTNTDGAHRCGCLSGFTGNGTSCEILSMDVGPCSPKNSSCLQANNTAKSKFLSRILRVSTKVYVVVEWLIFLLKPNRLSVPNYSHVSYLSKEKRNFTRAVIDVGQGNILFNKGVLFIGETLQHM